MRIAADDCQAELKLNRQTILRLEPFSPTTDVDVSRFLIAGENRVEFVTKSTGAAPALAARLVVDMAQGEPLQLITNGDWTVRTGMAEGGEQQAKRPAAAMPLGSVSVELWGLDRRPATIDPFDNYEQWRHALGDKGAASAACFLDSTGL